MRSHFATDEALIATARLDEATLAKKIEQAYDREDKPLQATVGSNPTRATFRGKMEWISVKDRLPHPCGHPEAIDHGWCLVVHENINRPYLSRYDADNSCYDHGWKYSMDYDITNWQYLPKVPDAKNKEKSESN